MSLQILATLYPDRITVRSQQSVNVRSEYEKKVLQQSKKKVSKKSLENLQIKKSSWSLSYQTKRKLENSIAMLNHLAKPRSIIQKGKKPIYNFRCSFVTLTLPSLQNHTDKEIKGVALNNFLTIMRQKFGVKNYVWKAELQKNESIHFHIVWDVYIHHAAVRYYWNQSLNLLGYVDVYAKKYSQMSLKEYAESRQIPVPQALSGFLQGNKTQWMSPPTEQVVAVRNGAQLAHYLRKYITKDVDEDDKKGKERIEEFGRVWGRSQSLSALKFVTRYDWDNLYAHIKSFGKIDENFHKVIYDYCTIYYINFANCSKKLLKWLNQKMVEIGITYGYFSPPAPLC